MTKVFCLLYAENVILCEKIKIDKNIGDRIMTKTGKSIYCGAIALVIFAMCRNYIPISNVMFYGIMCAVFICAALFVYFLYDKGMLGVQGKKCIENGWSIVPVLSLAVWMILFFVNETKIEHGLDENMLIRKQFPLVLWLAVTVLGTAVCLVILNRNFGDAKKKFKAKIRAIVSVLFAIGTSVQIYAPNIFLDVQGGTYHSHAYTNSIINVCWLIPYSEDMQALYGHYAIFYMPFLKVLHSLFDVDYLTGCFLVSAVIAGVSILLYLWIINYFAKKDVIFYLAMLAIGEYYFMLMQGGVFLQVHPHRMIFPILVMALALLECRMNKKYSFAAVMILAFSTVWSTEVGLVLMVAFALYRWVQKVMDGNAFCLRKVFLFFNEFGIYFVIPFAAAYGIVNGYNLLAKGPLLDIPEFMFPLISDRGYVGAIELPLPDVTHAWIGVSVLFLIPVCIVAFSVLFPVKGKDTKWHPFYFLNGIMGLGLVVYYVNRAAEGSLFIILFLMLILQVIILQKAQDVYETRKTENRFLFLSMRVITTMILFVMAFDCVYSMPKAWKMSSETIWKRAELQEFMDYVYVQVPPDAVSFGEAVPEIMSMIDRDTHLHTTEWSYKNTPIETMERVRYGLEGEKWIFCNLYTLYLMQEEFPGLTDQYELREVFTYGGAEFGFWEIKE